MLLYTFVKTHRILKHTDCALMDANLRISVGKSRDSRREFRMCLKEYKVLKIYKITSLKVVTGDRVRIWTNVEKNSICRKICKT